MSREAMCYKKEDGKSASCFLCSHRCRIPDGGSGICAVRENKGGVLYTNVYGKAIAAHVDPIEKKPIFHMLPGTRSFSFATVGCNFHCGFCQNWQISQFKEARDAALEAAEMSPEEIVGQAERHGCKSVSYTYTEPTIFFEYAYDTARLASGRGLKNIFVTNGYMTEEALGTIRPYLDAANVDLKSYSDAYYGRICAARLQPVLDSIKRMKRSGIWVEVTTLILPGTNDSPDELKQLAAFIAGVGVDIPWHISRFHPDYSMTDLKATPVETLEMAADIGKEAGLRYVYIGNLTQEENTYCYNCNTLLIRRFGFSVLEKTLKDGRCPKCRTALDGKALG